MAVGLVLVDDKIFWLAVLDQIDQGSTSVAEVISWFLYQDCQKAMISWSLLFFTIYSATIGYVKTTSIYNELSSPNIVNVTCYQWIKKCQILVKCAVKEFKWKIIGSFHSFCIFQKKVPWCRNRDCAYYTILHHASLQLQYNCNGRNDNSIYR